ncbi:MAG: carbohydrate kinase family protein [Thermoplasmata archaeon]|nr:carbohydrate kinase family protein [Thermoplasmata archaeon]
MEGKGPMNFSLSVFGHANLDYIVGLDHLPEPNTSIEMEHQERFFGGTAANIARASSKLGVRTNLSSFVGPDFPDDFWRALKEEGVDLTDLRKVEGYLTPMCWILSDPEHNQIAVINQGPMRDADDFPITKHSIVHGDVVHICTGRPGYHMRVMAEARRLGKKIGFDPAQEIHYVYDPKTFTEMLSLSTFFFCNESELSRALEYTGKREAEELLSYVPTLIVTRGKNGSSIYTAGEKLDIPIVPPDKVVDTTGAGDAYRGGFYAAMSRSMDLHQCGLHGAASSSFAVEAVGPQTRLATWKELRERLERSSLG